MGLHIIVHEIAPDEFEYFGPFKTDQHAAEAIPQAGFKSGLWWVAPLQEKP